MPRLGLSLSVFSASVSAGLLVLGGCAQERATIDPVPPAPLASGYETQSSAAYDASEYEPYDPEAAAPAPVMAEEPVVVAEEPIVVIDEEPVVAATPVPIKDGAPLKDGAPMDGAPLKDGGTTAGGQVHVIAEGDSLWKLSETYYGTGLKWEDILNANPGIDPKKLMVGKELIIP